MADFIPDFPENLPANVQAALDGLLTDVYSSKVRQDIVDVLTWGMNNAIEVARFINALGLCVSNGKLCYTNEDVLPGYNSIPADISSALQRILTDVYGPKLREDIVTVLRFASTFTGKISGVIEDLGLTVVDGKLCVIYEPA